MTKKQRLYLTILIVAVGVSSNLSLPGTAQEFWFGHVAIGIVWGIILWSAGNFSKDDSGE